VTGDGGLKIKLLTLAIPKEVQKYGNGITERIGRYAIIDVKARFEFRHEKD